MLQYIFDITMDKIVQLVADKKNLCPLLTKQSTQKDVLLQTSSYSKYFGNSDCPRKTFLLNCEVIKSECHFTITKMFNNYIIDRIRNWKNYYLLWPGGIQYDNVLLFVNCNSDAAPYMIKARKSIQ